MKEIVAHEKSCRGVYTGAIGYWGAAGNFTLNVAIRTALIRQGKLTFQTGGGIVVDSDPRLEFEETLHKARGIYLAWHRVNQQMQGSGRFDE
jgi:anthranilate/para-aminobenzoate synthase component I